MLGSIDMRVMSILPAAALLAAACAGQPRAVPIVGPDGSPMYHVSCGGSEASCYELAGRQCPQGYEIARTQGESGNYLVRCRARGVVGTWTQPSPGGGWAPTLDLAPSPYSTPMGAAPHRAPSPPGYPPLGPSNPSPGGTDVGY